MSTVEEVLKDENDDGDLGSSPDVKPLKNEVGEMESAPVELSNEESDKNQLIMMNGDVGCDQLLDDEKISSNVIGDVSVESSSDDSGTETNVEVFTSAQAKKIKNVEDVLSTCNISELRKLAISDYGLVSDDLRRKIWPLLVGVDLSEKSPQPTKEAIENHPYYQQVLLDVNRSLKRFPPSIKEHRRLAMQDQLVHLIMRILVKHPTLHYYQGYHDICVTFLLVLGEETAFHVVDRLSTTHLNAFMQKSMEPTVEMLNYIYPIIDKENHHLCEFLEKSEVGVMFALSWLITWFGHVLQKYSDVVRLFDFFLVSSHWMPVYLSAAIVLHREYEILEQDCDLAAVHSLLLKIPDDLPFEALLVQSHFLFKAYPPETVKDIVIDQMRKKKAALKPRAQRRGRGAICSVVMAVRDTVPKKKFAVSLFFAAAVVVGAVVYQTYKT